MNPYDVLIVGAGPTGLASAIEVQRRQKHDYKMMFYLITLRTGIHPSEVAPSFITLSLNHLSPSTTPCWLRVWTSNPPSVPVISSTCSYWWISRR